MVYTQPPAQIEIRPQPGPQTQFLECEADFVLMGGAGGGGKTYITLMEPVRHAGNGRFSCVMFRRTYPEIENPGGLWDSSTMIYPHCRAKPKESDNEWEFPSGAKVAFRHMEYEKDRFKWDGAQIPLICFDQLEHFTYSQFFYMFSRNRDGMNCGVRPYIRATCNPDPDHWLREFIDWYIDPEGYPDPNRCGIVRYFVIRNNRVEWGDSEIDLILKLGANTRPNSFTFIPAVLEDNPALMENDPSYEARLDALPLVDWMRLRKGNWNTRPMAGGYFRREQFEVLKAHPPLVDVIRYWDRAGTKDKEQKAKGTAPIDDPKQQKSWTAGIKVGVDANGVYYILDMSRFREEPPEVRAKIKNVASQDSTRVRIGVEQDPGQAGKFEAEDLVKQLAGFKGEVNPVRESKGARALAVASQVKVGNVKIIAGDWNKQFFAEAENFDGTGKGTTDQIDALSGAFAMLTTEKIAGAWGRR